jgi:hypothetical protein
MTTIALLLLAAVTAAPETSSMVGAGTPKPRPSRGERCAVVQSIVDASGECKVGGGLALYSCLTATAEDSTRLGRKVVIFATWRGFGRDRMTPLFDKGETCNSEIFMLSEEPGDARLLPERVIHIDCRLPGFDGEFPKAFSFGFWTQNSTKPRDVLPPSFPFTFYWGTARSGRAWASKVEGMGGGIPWEELSSPTGDEAPETDRRP